MTAAATSRGLVLGCGAQVGFAWSLGALTAVEQELGWDARSADVIVGTSAGAELAAMLGAGFSVAELVAALQGQEPAPALIADHLRAGPGLLPALPRIGLTAPAYSARLREGKVDALAAFAGLLPKGGGDQRWLRALATALSGSSQWVSHPQTWLVAADRRSGERIPFGAPASPPADLGSAIAASWAVPGMFAPVEISGREYIDGGVVSPTSADLVAQLGLDEVVIVAPMSTAGGAGGRGLSRVERLVRKRMTRCVDDEVAVLEAAGTKVIRVEPGQEDLDVMGFNFADPRRQGVTLATSHLTSPERVRAALAASVVVSSVA